MKIEVDLGRVMKKLSQGNIDTGRYALANQAMADMHQFVPMKGNDLRTTTHIDTDGSSINYNMPYAKAQYYGFVGKGGYPVRNYTTPGTGPRWDEKAKSIYMNGWIKAFVEGADW